MDKDNGGTIEVDELEEAYRHLSADFKQLRIKDKAT